MSALLYVIQAGPLASAIRNNKDIKGINVLNNTDDRELKLCQYVDDTNIVFKSEVHIAMLGYDQRIWKDIRVKIK